MWAVMNGWERGWCPAEDKRRASDKPEAEETQLITREHLEAQITEA